MRCGFYEVDITPHLGSNIYGYFYERLVSGVRDRLHAKAMVIDCGDSPAAIVSMDMIYIPSGDFRSLVIKRVQSLVPAWKSENFAIFATHSHTSGPYKASNEIDKVYLENIVYQVADCIVLAYRSMDDMQISYAEGKAENIAFIRNYRMKNGEVRTNPEFRSPNIIGPYGDNNDTVPIMYFKSADGTPKAALVNFACHHDCVHGELACADYSGVLAEELKYAYGNDFISVFLNGFCGNINNWNIMGADEMPPSEDYIRMGKILAQTVIENEAKAELIPDANATVAEVRIPMYKRKLEDGYLDKMIAYAEDRDDKELFNIIDEPDSDGFDRAVSKEFVYIYRDHPDVIDAIIHAFKIGDCLIYTVPGEIFSQYADTLKSKSPAKRVMMAELSDFGLSFYVPARELIGYDTVYENHPISRVFEEDTGDRIVEAALLAGSKLI